MALSDLLQGCSDKSVIQSWYNKNVTRLTTQGCNNIVISWLYRTWWNNLATSLIIPTRLLQDVNSLFQTCWQLGISSASTTSISSMFHINRNDNYNLRNNNVNYALPKPKTDFMKKSISYSAVSLWNSLPKAAKVNDVSIWQLKQFSRADYNE
jgi:hypothetical protein